MDVSLVDVFGLPVHKEFKVRGSGYLLLLFLA